MMWVFLYTLSSVCSGKDFFLSLLSSYPSCDKFCEALYMPGCIAHMELAYIFVHLTPELLMHMRDGSATSAPVRLGHKLLFPRIPMHGAHMHWGCTSNPGALGVACFSCGAAYTRLCTGLGVLWFPGFGTAEPQFRWAPRVQPSTWPDLTSADAVEPF